jgi:hypothetical protein
MDKQQILEIAKRDPRFSRAILTLENQIGDMPITSKQLDELVQLLELALNNPDKYPQIIASAVKDDMLEEGDLPEQFDPVAIISLLVLLYGMQERTKQKGYARGGLAAMGRHGDTMLAHINPREAEMLQRMGGSGTINPRTGYPEYFSFKKFLAVALPIALSFIAPTLGASIGTSMGFTGTAATMAGSAVIGGTTAALTGGDPLKGALLGGLGAGAGDYFGSAANKAFDMGLGTAGQNVLGSSLVGGVAGAASGQGFLKGAATGALGAYAGQQAGDLTGNASIGAGGKQFGNMLAAGYDPKSAVIGGGLAGLATAMSEPANSRLGLKPSNAVVDGLKMPKTGGYGLDTVTPASFGTTNFLTGDVGYTGPESFEVGKNVDYSLGRPTPQGYGAETLGSGITANNQLGSGINSSNQSALSQLKTSGSTGSSSPFTMKNALMGATLLGSLGSAPPEVKQAVSTMSPKQQEYFSRPMFQWDWTRMQKDANTAGLGLSQYMAQAWPQITGGAYNIPVQRPAGLARGGALSQIAYMARGSGSGRDDTIDAKLSDGEYVMDAETVALLGDGSTKAGAERLDAMRSQLRRQKGRELAKGKFSPNAKSPLAYLKGAM